jgi:hypothetical protein
MNERTFPQLLVPPAPTAARCNVPGTTGYLGYRDPNGAHYLLFDPMFKVMGSGRTASSHYDPRLNPV